MDGTHFYLIYHSSSSLWQLHMDLAKVFGDHMKDRIASWIDGDGECYNLEATVDEDAAYNAAYTNLQNKPKSQVTLQKKEVWDQLFCPAKCFKICHIYRKRKPT